MQALPAADTVTLKAQSLRSTPDQETVAEGEVELRQDGLLIRADMLRYRPAGDRALASGQVRVEREGAVYRGRELELTVKDFSGWFIAPEFDYPLLGTGGRAERIDFESRSRLRATELRYTSCPRDGSGDPDWVLQARTVRLDFDANEGIADGAVLRFLGLPILALPAMSFPITGERKSGWLPPTINLDSRSGLEVKLPYYWNIAPDLDATLAPRAITRRGAGLDTELRYLRPQWQGQASLSGLPDDRLAGRSRYALAWQHEQQAGASLRLSWDALRVSDDDWWKDFPRGVDSLTPRLLASRAAAERDFEWRGLALQAYARVQDWQVLQDLDAPIVSPYARRPQLGLAGQGQVGPLTLDLRSEVNRFERPSHGLVDARVDGWRWHGSGSVSWPWRQPGAWLAPRLTLQATRYRTDQAMSDGQYQASRLLPTLSVDAGLEFERETASFFGRALRQTLEPRLLYVRTPYKRQDQLPVFDSHGRDFNVSSIYATNAFSGVDRISDAHQFTVGVTSRLLDPGSGAELLRLGAVQRYRLRDQQVTAQDSGAVDGPVQDQRLSDLLLLGSTRLFPGWALDASLQYSPDSARLTRSMLGGVWSPGPFRTLSARYRSTRGVSEQIELGWQWPLSSGRGALASTGSGCQGRWYGVGRVNYSFEDSRVTDSVLGLEYDAGCWIARVVSERLSTGRSEATTRLLLQLELVGLSRLGSNPLQVLKDNIPGYRLLREERGDDPSAL